MVITREEETWLQRKRKKARKKTKRKRTRKKEDSSYVGSQ